MSAHFSGKGWTKARLEYSRADYRYLVREKHIRICSCMGSIAILMKEGFADAQPILFVFMNVGIYV